MPMSAAYARKLLQSGRAQLHPHYAFTVVQLAQVIQQPSLRPVLLGLVLHRHTAELFLLAEGEHTVFPLLSLVVDLYTDVPRRIRRRAAHRRRRRARGRYRPDRRHGQPFIVRRPSVAHSQRSSHRRYQRHRSAPGHISPTMHWRAQAVERVIAMVRKLVPISHVVILDPPSIPDPEYASVTPAERRRYLIDTYGTLNAQGERRAVCAYCGTTAGTIEVDHILPVSRGGTDAWSNLVPACASCNAQKGDRTPEEAGMPLRIPSAAGLFRSHRADAYRRWTARLLAKNLTHAGLQVVWTPSRGSIPQLPSSDIRHAFADVGANPQAYPMQFVAKPVACPRKQQFTARNYPESLSEKGWSWGDGPGAGVPASAGSGHTPAEAGTPGALSGVAGHPACRGTDANHLFRQSLTPLPYVHPMCEWVARLSAACGSIGHWRSGARMNRWLCALSASMRSGRKRHTSLLQRACCARASVPVAVVFVSSASQCSGSLSHNNVRNNRRSTQMSLPVTRYVEIPVSSRQGA